MSAIAAAEIPAQSRSSSGVPEPGICVTAILTTLPERIPAGRERREHGVAEPSLDPVVLDRDDQTGLGDAARGASAASIGLIE